MMSFSNDYIYRYVPQFGCGDFYFQKTMVGNDVKVEFKSSHLWLHYLAMAIASFLYAFASLCTVSTYEQNWSLRKLWPLRQKWIKWAVPCVCRVQPYVDVSEERNFNITKRGRTSPKILYKQTSSCSYIYISTGMESIQERGEDQTYQLYYVLKFSEVYLSSTEEKWGGSALWLGKSYEYCM